MNEEKEGRHTIVAVSRLPDCDVCPAGHQLAAHYDGRTKRGPWAYMCEDHFQELGVGLGLGRGQRLQVKDVQDDRIPPMGT